MCGAATATDASHCEYCKSRLATISCSSCLGSMFLGSKFCPRCGAPAGVRESGGDAAKKCPRCSLTMNSIRIGTTSLRECEKCLGLWLGVSEFEKLCADREQQSAVLGAASPVPSHEAREPNKIRYVPCPQCGQLMNRINFARCSGVIVDVCKGHGTWFDHDELSKIVEFIHDGGLEASRAREKIAIDEERRKLEREKLSVELRMSDQQLSDENRKIIGISSTRGLLKFLLD